MRAWIPIFLVGTGCADRLPSRSSVDPGALRVLAVRAESPEIRPDEGTVLTAFVWPREIRVQRGADEVTIEATAAWIACADPPGGDPSRCVEREDAWPLREGLETVVDARDAPDGASSIGAVAYVCLGDLLAQHIPPICEGDLAVAAKRVSISGTPQNTNPAIERLSLGGDEIPGDGIAFGACLDTCPRYRLAVDPADDAAQTIPGAGRRESLLVAFATDRGAFDRGFDDGTPFEAQFTPSTGAGDANVWIVLHDDRGGVGLRQILVRTE